MIELANVTRVEGDKVHVTIPRLAAQHEFGPCLMVEGLYTEDRVTRNKVETDGAHAQFTGTGVHTHDHDHLIAPVGTELKAGDKVIVGFLSGIQGLPVVLGRLV